MPEYCKEYIELSNLTDEPKFSLEKVFQGLKENSSIEKVCDGFGFVKIHDIDEECFVETTDGSKISFQDLTGRIIEKRESYKGLIYLGLAVTTIWLLSWYFMVNYYDYFLKDKEGVLIPTDPMSDRGTFGDMFGAVNALFSGLAFAGVIYAIILQRKELKLQRKELKETRKEFETQNATLTFQRFENTFFQMIELHHEIVDKLQFSHNKEKFITQNFYQSEKYEKREMLSFANDVLLDILNSNFNENQRTKSKRGIEETDKKNAWGEIQNSYEELYYDFKFGPKLSHYFMNLYHIFKFIHLNNYLDGNQKANYASIARAQLSQDELMLLFYNSMYEYHGNPKFLFLMGEYQILENFDFSEVGKFKHEEIYNELITVVKDPFLTDESEPVQPSF